MISRKKLLQRAEQAQRESKYLDFKTDFDVSSNAEWCELIKDIVAFANSGGGIIIIGVNNDGTNSAANTDKLLKYDIADVTNKIEKYTSYNFGDIEIVEVKRGKKRRAAFLISATDVPLIFTRPGTYDIGGGKQKTAFGRGTLYFRHGAKSEPGKRDDLFKWRDEAVATIKDSWLKGIQQVVEAPTGHAVAVISSASVSAKARSTVQAKISTAPDAIRVVPRNAEELWPHRQKDVIREVNRRLLGKKKINSFDILCINKVHDILNTHPDFAYKPYRLTSPQYSDAYVDWIVANASKKPSFFQETRQACKKDDGTPVT